MKITLEIDSRSPTISPAVLRDIFADMAQAMERISAPYRQPTERTCITAIFTRDRENSCAVSGQLWLEAE